MANNPDILPPGDQDFDDLQQILVAAVVLNAVAWNISASEILALTTAQTPWTNTWAIAKNKQNATSAQREAKDEARKSYEAVLRPFIQKWIYRNSSMTPDDVMECGIKPRDTERTPAQKIGLVSGIILKRGLPLEIIAECPKTIGAKYFGCIITENGPLPPGAVISVDGKLVFSQDMFPGPGPIFTALAFDLSEQRIKHFTNLQHDAVYYVYFYLVNAAGVSPLTEPVSIVCW